MTGQAEGNIVAGKMCFASEFVAANRIHGPGMPQKSFVPAMAALQRGPAIWRRTLPGFLLLALVAMLAAGCATMMPAPSDFLRSQDASWNQWMDTAVDVRLTDVRIAHLPLTDAFLGLSIVVARSDASLRWLPVTLSGSSRNGTDWR
jgi:hypothetical protein